MRGQQPVFGVGAASVDQQVVEREGGVSVTRRIADALGAAYTLLWETQAAAKHI